MSIRRGVNEFLWVAGPKILGGGLQLAFSILLLRHFGPTQFGVISVCLAGILLSDSIIGGATDSGVLRLAPLHNTTSPQLSLQYQQSGMIYKLMLAGAAALPISLLARPISRCLFQDPSGSAALLVSLSALLGMLSLRSAQMHFQVNRRFAAYGVAELLNAAAKFGPLGLVLLFLRPTPVGVLAIFALGPLSVMVGILLTSARPLLTVPFATRPLWELAGTVKWYLATAAMGTLIARMDIFLVSALAGINEAGIYSAAQTIALLPHLIGTYIAVVFSPRIVPMSRDGTLLRLYERFQGWMLGFVAVIFIAACFWAKGIATALFPASFSRATDIVLLLLPAGLCGLINFPITILLLLFQRPKFLLAVDCVLFPVLLLLYGWLVPIHGAKGAAIITSGAALVKTLIMQATAWRLLRSRVPMLDSEDDGAVLKDEVLDARG